MNAKTMQEESPPSTLERMTYDLAEFAEIMGISYRHAIDLANGNELPGVIRLGRRWLISKEAVDQMLQEGNTQTR